MELGLGLCVGPGGLLLLLLAVEEAGVGAVLAGVPGRRRRARHGLRTRHPVLPESREGVTRRVSRLIRCRRTEENITYFFSETYFKAL